MSDEELVFTTPGKSKGLLEVVNRRYLTSLLVHKELQIRYRGSVLGMLWSYAKPLTQFLVFYFAIGMFMGMNDRISNYVIYMFSGVVAINTFSETFANATRSVSINAPLVKKIYLPRQLFPVSSLWVGLTHFLPQLVILVGGALIVGWRPGWLNLGAVLLGLLIVMVFTLGLGLLGAAINVFFRDAENFVELIQMLATWVSPVLYGWTMVHDKLEKWGLLWIWVVYQLNPLTVAVELFHFGFWQPTLGAGDGTEIDLAGALPPNMGLWIGCALVISCGTLIIGEVVFRRLDPRFAQEL